MLHIIFVILKILGILILILLSLLLLILLSILFVPVAYRIKGSKNAESGLQGQVILGWMFGLIRVAAAYKDGTSSIKVHLLGISLETYKKIGQKLKRKKKHSKKVVPEGKKTLEESAAEQNPEDILHQSKEEDSRTGEGARDGEEKKSQENEKLSALQLFFQKISRLIGKLIRLPSRIIQRIKKIQLTLRRIYDKIRQWKKFLRDENTKEAFRCLKENAGDLIRHMLPRKVKGYVRYGFDDPALTGQTLGAVSMILPLYKSGFQVIPVFDEEILEGDVLLKGRIFGFVLLKAAWRVYRSQSVKKTIRKFQHKEA